MLPQIGFSTGALAFGDFRAGLEMLRERRISVVELSSLRDKELPLLIEAIDSIPVGDFTYVSIHAPSALSTLSESRAVELLTRIVPRRWPIIVHPDILKNPDLWTPFGDLLCIENMDKRKPIARTARELEPIFKAFPAASFCFDIGHARQVDPTMNEAALMLRRFGNRIRQIHMSEVDSSSKHEPISFTAMSAFERVAELMPSGAPIILESVIPESRIDDEIETASRIAMTGQRIRNAAY